MKKSFMLLIPALFLLLTFLIIKERRSNAVENDEKYFYQKIKEFKDSGKDSIPLKELTNFEWENVCYVWPYGDNKDKRFIGAKLNKEIPEDDNDGKFGVIFTYKGSGRVFRISRKDFNAQEECSSIKNAELKRCAESSPSKQGRCSELRRGNKL
ncbi:MAG: hypothetical protein KGP29_05445 [Proteobacteria bacterium]|nr:hypothetical protein [Pseudomonadota bacterium]